MLEDIQFTLVLTLSPFDAGIRPLESVFQFAHLDFGITRIEAGEFINLPLGDIDIKTCRECGGATKVLACLEDPVGTAKRLLAHLNEKAASAGTSLLREDRKPACSTEL